MRFTMMVLEIEHGGRWNLHQHKSFDRWREFFFTAALEAS